MRFRGAPNIARLLAKHETDVRLARELTGTLPMSQLPDATGLFATAPPAERAQLIELGLDENLARSLYERCKLAASAA